MNNNIVRSWGKHIGSDYRFGEVDSLSEVTLTDAFLFQPVPRPLVSTMARASLTQLGLTSVPAWLATLGSIVKTVSVTLGVSGACKGIWGLTALGFLVIPSGVSEMAHYIWAPES